MAERAGVEDLLSSSGSVAIPFLNHTSTYSHLSTTVASRFSLTDSGMMGPAPGKDPRLCLALALPLVGHQHPLLPALIHELPYVPETIQRIQDSDRRLPHRPLMYVKGNRSDLNKMAIDPSRGPRHRDVTWAVSSARLPYRGHFPRSFGLLSNAETLSLRLP